MNDDQYNNKPSESPLNSLDWDIQPERDLWPDIHSNIRFAGKPKLDLDDDEDSSQTTGKGRVIAWAPVSIAACMMFAFGAFVMSMLSYQRAQDTYEMQASYIEFQKSQISLIEQQHAHVRAQFVALLDGKLGPIDPGTAAEIQAVLMTIDEASVELKQAILAEPLNTHYSTMLARTYQEELKLLNKFKAKDGRPSQEVSL